MPAAVGDLNLLARAVQAQRSLLGYAKVLSGKNLLASAGAPQRVVVFPVGASNGVAEDRTVSVSSAWMLVTFHFWAGDLDIAFEFRTRFFQALRAQADAGGYYWKMPEGENERWDTKPDTAQQGQEFEIDVLVMVDALLPAKTRGKVEATSLLRVPELAADIDANDTTIPAQFTYELPASGVLYIEDEKITYSSVTGDSFTGVTRGVGGTIAAAHTAGKPVYVAID